MIEIREWRFWVKAGSAAMFLAVALGAFGAHGLKNVLGQTMREVYETAVRYQVYHALALFAVAWLAHVNPSSRAVCAAGWCFVFGIVLFSGSLYALSVTGYKILGIITPLGGLLFLSGWACLFFAKL
ncbi:MAG: DUF423 domain-containing protein [Elusimicrobia bacterium]|nr:DUF423 domain-containing protein [Elusimicrobiota bacterium]